MEGEKKVSACNLLKDQDYLTTDILARSKDITALRFSTAKQLTYDILSFTNLTSLDVAKCGLPETPEVLCQLVTLESINMSCNSLKCLHPNVGKLIKLKELQLNSNMLTALPNSVGSMSELRLLLVKDNCLSELPETIGNLSELVVVDASYNDLSHLPQCIGGLTKLQRMDLRQNCIQELPSTIETLSELSYLDISRNRVREDLPNSFGKLQKLKHLDLSYNRLIRLPESFGCLQMLQLVDLSCNDLRHIPDSFGNLLELLLLSLSWNRLSTLPDSMGNLLKLKILCIRNNNFHALPIVLTKMTALNMLDLSNGPSNFVSGYANNIGLTYADEGLTGFDEHHLEEDVPLRRSKKRFSIKFMSKKASKKQATAATTKVRNCPQARYMENVDMVIQRNEISELPAQMMDLKLERLYLEGNPMSRPPHEICREGPKATLQYLKYINEGSKMVCTDSLSMLGDSGAGKTSLVRSLQHGFALRTAAEDRTRVLDQVEVPLRAFSTNVNDFGGHDIYQTVLPVFLPTDGIVIVAYDLTLPLSEQEETVKRWLLTAFSRSPGARVVVVGTHADLTDAQHRLELTQHMKGFIHTLLIDAKLEISAHSSSVASCEDDSLNQQRVSFLADRLEKLESLDLNYVTTGCDGDGAQHDLNILTDTLVRLIKPKIVLPASWCSAIDDILNPRSSEFSNKLYLTWDDVVAITCRHLQKDQSCDSLQVILQYLAATSQIIWLRQHARLGKVIFHKIKRIVDAFRTVLHHDQSPQLLHSLFELDIEQYNRGNLSRRLLEHFLKSFDRDIEPIVELMMDFNLICPAIDQGKDTHYLIPCRLLDVAPEDLVGRVQAHQHNPFVHISLMFKCTVIPLAFFETSLASLVAMLHTQGATFSVWKNGLAARHDGATVVYRRLESIISIQAAAESTVLKMWKLTEPILRRVTEYIVRMWKGAMPYTVFACPGCVCLKSQDAQLPPRGRLTKNLSELRYSSSALRGIWYCQNCQLDIPTSLVSPQKSDEINSQQQEITKAFLKTLAQKCVVCSSARPLSVCGSDTLCATQRECHSAITPVDIEATKKITSKYETELCKRFRKAAPRLNKQLDKSTILEVLDKLYADELLSQQDVEDVQQKKTPIKMARKLTKLTCYRGEPAIRALLEIFDSSDVRRSDLAQYVRAIRLGPDRDSTTDDSSAASTPSKDFTILGEASPTTKIT